MVVLTFPTKSLSVNSTRFDLHYDIGWHDCCLGRTELDSCECWPVLTCLLEQQSFGNALHGQVGISMTL